MSNRQLFGGVLIIISVLVFGFLAGMRFQLVRGIYSQRIRNNFVQGQNQRGMMYPMMGRGRGNFGGQFTGQITNISGNQLQITLPNGQVININLTNSTTYSQVSLANQQSLKVGQNVSIFEQRTPGGTVSAQSVRIN